MIPINELRFGNWIEDSESKKRYQIEWFSKSAEDLCNPISLTPEILEKCGFKKKTELNYEVDLIRDLDYPDQNIIADKIKVFDFGTGKFSVWGTSGYLNTIKYLHQLQNLYFALTGKELEINSEILNGNTSKV